ncbi:MAG: preprotein translocase subunit SecG [Alphaproteobacteria bacterium]|nr:preprotein translocase subunit SecG [Alphaproteobacteria bacterium]TAD89475.1 MAG: preprotein translocase subunit SecG [Alphaproteobacteria bacterium]
METILLVIHLLLALALVGVILIQRSEGGGLGIGGGNSGGFMTTRGTTTMLTRTTAILATAFICTSLLLAVFATRARAPAAPTSILDQSAPVAPAAPQIPLAR